MILHGFRFLSPIPEKVPEQFEVLSISLNGQLTTATFKLQIAAMR